MSRPRYLFSKSFPLLGRRLKMNSFKLEPGDIVAMKGNKIVVWLQNLFLKPETDRVHHFILWQYLGEDDFLILESIAKGLAIGKLSWYEGQDLQFFRVDCPQELRYAAPDGLIDWGRSRYDYLLIAKLFFGAFVALAKVLWKERRLRKLWPEDLPYGGNSSLICTEGPDVAYDSVGVNVIPAGVAPIPTSFRAAELEGRLIRLW